MRQKYRLWIGGFLFGDGVYEVIPCYVGKTVALQYHMDRLRHSLHEIQLPIAPSDSDLEAILKELIIQNGNGNVGIYLQITRGVVEKRQHAFPERASPTVFAYTFPINPPSNGAADNATCFTTVTRADTRWARCHIKSTALLGNVLHMMEAVNEGAEEVLLFNEQDLLTEAAAMQCFYRKRRPSSHPRAGSSKATRRDPPPLSRTTRKIYGLAGAGWARQSRSSHVG